MPTFAHPLTRCRACTTERRESARLFHLDRCLIQSCLANGTREALCADTHNTNRPAHPGKAAHAGLAVIRPTCFPTETLSLIAVARVEQTVILRGGNRMANATGLNYTADTPAEKQDRAR